MRKTLFTIIVILYSIIGYGQTYRVGDIYNKYGYKGIVFEVDTSGKHGKIIALEDTYGHWAIDANFDNMYSSKLVGAKDSRNGKVNTQVIKSINNWRRCFPVFREIDDLPGDWYLPSKEELIAVARVYQKLNNTLSMYDYPILRGNYYSSTEVANDAVWNVWFDRNGRIDIYEVNKETNGIKSRAIATF